MLIGSPWFITGKFLCSFGNRTMNISILNAFIADQRKAKAIVSKHLDVPENIPAIDWTRQYSSVQKKFAEKPFADVFVPHGYGLELKIGELYIDYDYSTEGRADGFDAWRLFVYVTAGEFDNRGPDKHLRDRVFGWVDELHSSGRLTHPDNLYYVANNDEWWPE